MMKVVLFNPPYSDIYGDYKPAAKVGVNYPPLGLMYLAAILKEDNHKVFLEDLEVNQWKEQQILDFLSKTNPDMVAIGSTTPTHHSAEDIFKLIKEFDQKIITVAGGPHPTILFNEVVKDPHIDFVIRGEGEITLKKLCAGLPIKSIKGLSFMKEGIPVNTDDRGLIEDLDQLPFPARYLLDKDNYQWSVTGEGFRPVTPITTTRGCCFNCTFCSGHLTQGKKIRYRSVDNVVEEIKLIHDYGIDYLVFEDDTFGVHTKRTYELLDAMSNLPFKIKCEGMTRANLATEELLTKMKKAGFVRLSFGIESGNQEILNNVKKGTKLEDYRKAFKLAKKIGFETRGSIIIGLPGETVKTIKNTIKFIKSLDLYQVYINIGTPFPGTEYQQQAKKGQGGLKLLTNNWREYRRWGGAVIECNELSSEDLVKWQRKAMLQFYLRPKIIWYNLFRRAGFKANLINGLSFLFSFIPKPLNRQNTE